MIPPTRPRTVVVVDRIRRSRSKISGAFALGRDGPMEGPTLDGLLRFAISNARLIQFFYRGVQRLAEPHDYGVLNNVARLLVYQRRSARSPIPGWRLLDVSKIDRLVVLEETFHGSRSASHRHHTRWDEVFVRVPGAEQARRP
jgi:hypothetical protein